LCQHENINLINSSLKLFEALCGNGENAAIGQTVNLFKFTR